MSTSHEANVCVYGPTSETVADPDLLPDTVGHCRSLVASPHCSPVAPLHRTQVAESRFDHGV